MSIPIEKQNDARRTVEALPGLRTIGTPCSHGGLTVFPLSVAGSASDLGYLTLDEALAGGEFKITEVSASGRVPELLVTNDGNKPVLLLDGEELVGSKQNRVPNVTILVPPRQAIVVPVSCVESGRWADVPADEVFGSAKHIMYAAARKASSADVRCSARMGQGYRSDQGRVWNMIAQKSARLGASSATSAMRDMFRARERDMEDYDAAFRADEDQTGAAFCIGDRVSGIELFNRPSTLRALLSKLVRSYAMDAIELTRDEREAPETSAVEAFVRDVARADKEVRPAVGLGEDVRLSAPALVGGALVYDREIVHLSVFPLDPADTEGTNPDRTGSRPGRLMSARGRRNRHL